MGPEGQNRRALEGLISEKNVGVRRVVKHKPHLAYRAVALEKLRDRSRRDRRGLALGIPVNAGRDRRESNGRQTVCDRQIKRIRVTRRKQIGRAHV